MYKNRKNEFKIQNLIKVNLVLKFLYEFYYINNIVEDKFDLIYY